MNVHPPEVKNGHKLDVMNTQFHETTELSNIVAPLIAIESLIIMRSCAREKKQMDITANSSLQLYY